MLHLLTLYRVRCNHGRLTQPGSIADMPSLTKGSSMVSTPSWDEESVGPGLQRKTTVCGWTPTVQPANRFIAVGEGRFRLILIQIWRADSPSPVGLSCSHHAANWRINRGHVYDRPSPSVELSSPFERGHKRSR